MSSRLVGKAAARHGSQAESCFQAPTWEMSASTLTAMINRGISQTIFDTNHRLADDWSEGLAGRPAAFD